VAVGGAIWSALVLLLAVFGMRPSPAAPAIPAKVAGASGKVVAQPSTRWDPSSRVAGYIFILSTVALAGVLYLAYASFFVLGQMCPLCIAMYVAVIGLFLVSGAAATDLAALPSRIGDDISRAVSSPLAATIGLIWVVGAVSLVAFFPREQAPADAVAAPVAMPTETLAEDEVAQFAAWLDAQPREDLGLPAEGARVVVAKFNDYQCPACRQAYLAYRGIEEKYEKEFPGQVAFVNLDYPLEAECNQGGIHSAACEAAVAVRLARAKDRGDEMEAWLFSNQESLTRDTVKAALNDVAQVSDFDARYAEVLDEVRADAQLGQRLKITGTPTFFVNGIRIGSTLRPSYMDAAIAHELRKATGANPQASSN
jgi:protein-disulfide isomerase